MFGVSKGDIVWIGGKGHGTVVHVQNAGGRPRYEVRTEGGEYLQFEGYDAVKRCQACVPYPEA